MVQNYFPTISKGRSKNDPLYSCEIVENPSTADVNQPLAAEEPNNHVDNSQRPEVEGKIVNCSRFVCPSYYTCRVVFVPTFY